MKPNIFMSYSRREVGFIDDLTFRLEKRGFKVWLDYRNLIPGTPWKGQIDKGLSETDVILLVVSKASMASQYVELEWRRVLTEKKRIILIIFEAVDLPPELEKFEWVDFRGSYNAGIRELIGQLETPIQEKHPAPETGFKVPLIVWVTAAVSVPMAFLSLFNLWTIILPVLLVPLPYRVFKRNFNYVQIRAALWLQTIAVFFLVISLSLPENSQINNLFSSVMNNSLLGSLLLLFLLRSAGMQRWGKPEATRSKFANVYHPKNHSPKPVSFYIDHASQDNRVANEIAKKLIKYRHPQAVDIKSAQSVFVLISAYKTDSEADPESQTVFPILVQTANPAEKLSKVQWIDFRAGVRNLDAIAQLLPEPAKLLTALGVRPNGNQLVLPPIINAVIYLLVISIAMTAGSFVGDTFSYILDDRENLAILPRFILACLSGGLAYRMVKALIERRGWLASVSGFVSGFVVLGILFAALPITAVTEEMVDVVTRIPLSFVTYVVYIAGGFILAFVALTFSRADFLRWLPWFPQRKN